MTNKPFKGAGEGPVKREPLRMRAYYYSFSETGNCEIDRILSAVACAGKAFHNTDCWNDECDPYFGHVGITPIDWIQNAANDCVTAFKSAHAEGRKSMENDFKELLEIAQSLYDDIGYDSADCKKFREWKKARWLK